MICLISLRLLHLQPPLRFNLIFGFELVW
jgi:hypothetical protein